MPSTSLVASIRAWSEPSGLLVFCCCGVSNGSNAANASVSCSRGRGAVVNVGVRGRPAAAKWTGGGGGGAAGAGEGESACELQLPMGGQSNVPPVDELPNERSRLLPLLLPEGDARLLDAPVHNDPLIGYLLE